MSKFKVGDKIRLVSDVKVLRDFDITSRPGTAGEVVRANPNFMEYEILMEDGMCWLAMEKHIEHFSASDRERANNPYISDDPTDWYDEYWD